MLCQHERQAPARSLPPMRAGDQGCDVTPAPETDHVIPTLTKVCVSAAGPLAVQQPRKRGPPNVASAAAEEAWWLVTAATGGHRAPAVFQRPKAF